MDKEVLMIMIGIVLIVLSFVAMLKGWDEVKRLEAQHNIDNNITNTPKTSWWNEPITSTTKGEAVVAGILLG